MITLPYIKGAIATYPPGATFSERYSLDYEFVWIIRGNAVWHVDSQDIPAPPGAVLLSRPRMRESYTWDTHRPTEHAYFHFQLPAKLPRDLPPPAAWLLIRPSDPANILHPLFTFIVATHRRTLKPTPSVCRAVETLLSVFTDGPLPGQTRPAPKIPPLPVCAALSYAAATLKTNPAAQLTLPDLADHAHVSPQHLCKLFTQHLGQTPLHILLALRLRHALNLLTRTDFKLERIAAECGFANAFHFSRRFTRHFGTSPSAMRSAIKSGRHPPTQILQLAENVTLEY